MDFRLRYAALAALALLAAALLASACGRSGERVADATPPAPRDLSSPESAVRSYLEWVSFSYRMADSNLSTPTMTPYEGVRIDSYIELNREKGRAIDQRLEEFEVRSRSEEGTTAVIAASETWRYRYFRLDDGRYLTPEYVTSYETTYTLSRTDSGWLVDEVDAQPLTEVK